MAVQDTIASAHVAAFANVTGFIAYITAILSVALAFFVRLAAAFAATVITVTIGAFSSGYFIVTDQIGLISVNFTLNKTTSRSQKALSFAQAMPIFL